MRFTRIASAMTLVAASVGAAQAGGFSRGTADTDILYEDGNFNLRAGAIIVVPTQKFKTAPSLAPNPALVGTDYLDTYVIPSAAAKFKISDNLSCAGTHTQVYGASSSYAAFYGPTGKVSEEFTVSEFGATCAVFFNVGKGRLAVLGGAFVEQFDYDFVGGFGTANIDLGSNAVGWRAGLAYEIPEIAFRTELMYRSGTSHDASGTYNMAPIATGSGELPQSLELKLQTGIAPGWLAFGSVRWTDWSVNETLQVYLGGAPLPPNEYYWRDGWTVTGGIGHAFTENVSGLVSLQWDRGVATGYDFRTDKWLLAAGLSMKDQLGGELRLGGAVSFLSSAEITKGLETGASVGSGWAGILSANYKVKW
ncbi:aromatic hydrocarbon degradation protein [Nitratireductor pacificus]|uniref:Aromatic hydrocarbon degradation membrane protein n=1 Tax=Nitratireductor pacificus pht-3B TaxID=391937 RepID=K2LGL8_9HYPH|nr:aromatic hydrocarbon degradation protein [Nitratireductor pacificus]EKF16929.1 aromatic hydrocarbon degradation membrane protein [Nitratireductor pacificus pht-3B]